MTDLKPLEIELIQLTAQGESAKQIGGKLNMKPHLVSNHLSYIRRRNNLTTSAHLVSWAYQNGILKVKEYEPA